MSVAAILPNFIYFAIQVFSKMTTRCMFDDMILYIFNRKYIFVNAYKNLRVRIELILSFTRICGEILKYLKVIFANLSFDWFIEIFRMIKNQFNN